MTDKNELKRLVDRVLNDRRFCGDENHRVLASSVLALLAEVERLSIREDVLENLCDARFRINLDLETKRDKLKAENEKLKSACSRADQIICDESKAAAFARARGNLLEADLEKLKAENEALRKDAERYRWLREKVGVDFIFGEYAPWLPGGEEGMDEIEKQTTDEAIDAAMSKGDKP